MNRPARFAEFIGNPRIVGIIERALERDRLPHALIFAGPEGVGKRTLAELVAMRLNCLSPAGPEPCGACRSCRKIAAGAHPDFRYVEPDGAFIKIDQVRALTGEIAFQPFEARYRVAVLDRAECMRNEAANSLLKTLEEPPSRTFLILITTSPYALLPTIHSRCRLLQFGGVPSGAIERFLTERAGRRPEDAQAAAGFSRGSLAAALEFDARRYEAARGQALEFVSLLLGGGGFTEASRLAAAVSKDKEKFEPWLDSVTAVLRDIYYAQATAGREAPVSTDDHVARLAKSADPESVCSAIEGLTELRQALVNNVNRQIALEALFLKRTSRSTARI